jgi:hypothetical protein
MKRYLFIGLVISAAVAALALLASPSMPHSDHGGGGSKVGTAADGPPTAI